MYSEPGRGPGLSLTRYMSSAVYRVTTYKMQRPKSFPHSLSLSLSGLECHAVSLTGKLVWESVFATVVLLLCLSVADGLL